MGAWLTPQGTTKTGALPRGVGLTPQRTPYGPALPLGVRPIPQGTTYLGTLPQSRTARDRLPPIPFTSTPYPLTKATHGHDAQMTSVARNPYPLAPSKRLYV